MDPVLESVTLEPELEEALANASDAELCDIAGKTVTCELGVELFSCYFIFFYGSSAIELVADCVNVTSFDRI